MNLIEVLQTNLGTPSLWIGLGTVFIFAIGRFNETRKDAEGLDPPILIRNFTTKFRFNFAVVTYGGVASILYVILICFGSIPDLQNFLKEWIGSVPGIMPGIKDATVGTPSWAALAITTAMPTLPPIAKLDQLLRQFLQEFASIPLKAQSIADELIAEISAHQKSTKDREGKIYDALTNIVTKLRHLKRLRAAEAYREFFAKTDTVIEQIKQRVIVLPDSGDCHDHAQLNKSELDPSIKKLARLIVCAMLTVEVDEYSVRRTLRDDLNLPGIRVRQWRFKSTQVVLSLIIVVLVTSVVAVGTSYFGILALPESKPTAVLVALISERLIGAGMFWGPVFLVPLLFCAGMRMHLIDLENFGETLEWDTKAILFLITTIGAILFSLLCTLFVWVIISWLIERPPNLPVILPWAGPPALFAVTFFILSSQKLLKSRFWNAIIDFVAHGSVVAIFGFLSVELSFFAGLDSRLFFVPDELMPYVATVTSAVIGATLGMSLCLISRVNIRRRQGSFARLIRRRLRLIRRRFQLV